MPDVPPPVPPQEQVALRARIEKLLQAYTSVATHSHEDRFWESDSGTVAARGWGTSIEPRTAGAPILVWFDEIDRDICVSSDRNGLTGPAWYEWRDLTGLDEVLNDVTDVLVSLLRGYR